MSMCPICRVSCRSTAQNKGHGFYETYRHLMLTGGHMSIGPPATPGQRAFRPYPAARVDRHTAIPISLISKACQQVCCGQMLTKRTGPPQAAR